MIKKITLEADERYIKIYSDFIESFKTMECWNELNKKDRANRTKQGIVAINNCMLEAGVIYGRSSAIGVLLTQSGIPEDDVNELLRVAEIMKDTNMDE